MLSPEIILMVKSSTIQKQVITKTSQTHLYTMPKARYYIEIQQNIYLFPLPSALRAANNGC